MIMSIFDQFAAITFQRFIPGPTAFLNDLLSFFKPDRPQRTIYIYIYIHTFDLPIYIYIYESMCKSTAYIYYVDVNI